MSHLWHNLIQPCPWPRGATDEISNVVDTTLDYVAKEKTETKKVHYYILKISLKKKSSHIITVYTFFPVAKDCPMISHWVFLLISLSYSSK